jgi:hypothetical protein
MHELLTPAPIDTLAPGDTRSAREDGISGLSRLFSGVDREELLIIGVLILIMTENADRELIIALLFLLLTDT